MTIKRSIKKFYNRIVRVLYPPIRVFVFHHVSDVRNPLICREEDWTRSDVFFHTIATLSKRYDFISLDKALELLGRIRIRRKRYAVLTTDDGLQSILRVFPWLESRGIPLTCFINAKYLDGRSYKKLDEIRIRREGYSGDISTVIAEQYLNYVLLFQLKSDLLTVSLHGYEHLDSTLISVSDFKENVVRCQDVLFKHPCYRPYFAYPWGRYNDMTNAILKEMGIVPVLVDGKMNYCYKGLIHRECIDGMIKDG